MPHRTSTPEDAAGSQATAEELPLKRERAGRYLTRDGRFAVEQNSGRWMLLDTEQTGEFEAAGARSAASPPPLDSVNARRFLARPDVHLLVASEGNELVGFALAYELLRRRGDPMELRVEEVAVRRSRRRQGIGRRLL